MIHACEQFPGASLEETLIGMLNIVVGEVDMGFDFSKKIGNSIPEAGDGRGKAPLQLLERHVAGRFGPGSNNIDDGFGAGKIDPAV
jgi:hypothetical protein